MTTDKRRAIRNTLARLGMQAKPGEVVEALSARGIEVSERLVNRVKIEMTRKEAKAMVERTKGRPKPKPRNRPQQRKIPPRRW